MRVLFFSHNFPNPWNPGLGTFNRTMLAGLAASSRLMESHATPNGGAAQHPHKVRIVSPIPWNQWYSSLIPGCKPKANFDTFEAIPGVPATYFPFYYPPKILRSQYHRCLAWSSQSILPQILREEQPDVVLSYWSHPDGAVATKMAHAAGIPSVVMTGGSDVLLLARSGSRRRAILEALHAADLVITVSENLSRVLIEDGLPPEKLAVVRRGVDTTIFQPGSKRAAREKLKQPQDVALLVAPGRLAPVKGWEYLLRACRSLADRGLRFRCVFVGHGSLQQRLQAQAEELQITNMIHFAGSCPQAELVDWYRAASVIVLPSISEGVPNVLMEAMASGANFVASEVGGIPEIADPYFDRLVPPAQPLSLANAIEDLLNHSPETDTESGMVRRWRPSSLEESTNHLIQALTTCVHRFHDQGGYIRGLADREYRQLIETNESSMADEYAYLSSSLVGGTP